jgi:hypothetical protein
MNRRAFLGLLAAVPLAATMRPNYRYTVSVCTPLGETRSGPLLPLYGDGIHDDTDAIQQRLDRFHYVYLPKGEYRVAGDVFVRSRS